MDSGPGQSACTVTNRKRDRKLHVLHSFLADRPDIVYSLRARSHNKSLVCKTSDLNERNFLVRVIYKDCY